MDIILIEPEWASNMGAVCRVMANFGFKNLVLVNPKCKKSDLDAIKRAKHALPILKRSKILKTFPKNYDLLIATTSQIGGDYNLPRLPITPEQLSKKINRIKKKKIGIVFGREGQGLTNDEIKKCDLLVSIPSSTKYPVLNLSHAVGIILYETFKYSKDKKLGDNIPLITKKEKDELLKLINKSLNKLKFNTKEKKQNQKTLWKRLINKSFLTKREAFALFGFFRKIK